jgi:exonuclease III
MPDGKNYSRINQGRRELIDHILISAALVKRITGIRVEAMTKQPLPSISADPNQRRNAICSDHAPVIATFSAM